MNIITRSKAKELGQLRYITGVPCKYGHTCERITKSGECIECKKRNNKNRVLSKEQKEISNKKAREWHKKNREKVRVRSKIYRNDNKESISKQRKEYRESNYENKREIDRVYYSKNKDRIKAKSREYYWENREMRIYKNKLYYLSNREKSIALNIKWRKEYRKTPISKVSEFIRDSLRRIVKRIKGNKEVSSLEVLPYTPLELKEHLENLFEIDMTWENYGKWHIDHIKPLIIIIKENQEKSQDELLLIANSLDNLQPLWERDNLIKAKY